MKSAFGALFLICLTASALADDNPVGFQSSTQLIADNAVFVSASAIRDTPPAAGEHPLVVLSHGFGGNWGSQTWLASALAHKGYIVAAVNHPGTTGRFRACMLTGD